MTFSGSPCWAGIAGDSQRSIRMIPLRRPLGLYAQPLNGSQILAENIVYGEGQAAAANLRGRIYQSYDAAGVWHQHLALTSREIY